MDIAYMKMQIVLSDPKDTVSSHLSEFQDDDNLSLKAQSEQQVEQKKMSEEEILNDKSIWEVTDDEEEEGDQ